MVDGPGRAGHDDERAIHVAIDASRVLRPPDGIRVHRLTGLEDKVLWHTAPPRQRLEQALLDLATEAEREVDVVAFLADAVQARQTTGERLASALRERTRISRRGFLEAVIADVSTGTCSALEHGYLVRVERPHGLPAARRQFAESPKGPVYRDAVHEEQDLIVELDGRLHHCSVHARDRDLGRDLDAVATERVTARLGWGQVFDRPCTTAAKVGRALRVRGWSGAPRRCPRCAADR